MVPSDESEETQLSLGLTKFGFTLKLNVDKFWRHLSLHGINM